MRDFPALFNVHVSSGNWTYLCFTRDEKNIPVTLWCSESVTQPANVCLVIGELLCVCTQSNSVAVKLYWGRQSNVCDECAIVADKNCNWQQRCFEMLDIRGWYCTGQRRLTASGTTTSTCTRSNADRTAQYSTEWLRIRTLIVQMVTITVISDTFHDVYWQQ